MSVFLLWAALGASTWLLWQHQSHGRDGESSPSITAALCLSQEEAAKHPWQELLWEPDFYWQKHFTSSNPSFLCPPLPTCVSLKSQTATTFCLALELPEDWENAAGEPLNERFHASIITLFSQPLHKIAK